MNTLNMIPNDKTSTLTKDLYPSPYRIIYWNHSCPCYNDGLVNLARVGDIVTSLSFSSCALRVAYMIDRAGLRE